jgi:mRNA-degrading endonuclease RelE of RelBE toxin-antitoxin system
MRNQNCSPAGSSTPPYSRHYLNARLLEIALLDKRGLSKEQRRNIGRRLDLLLKDLAGDVRKLTARTHEYRLRVGHLRVLFMLEGDLISVYRVKDRKEAYE